MCSACAINLEWGFCRKKTHSVPPRHRPQLNTTTRRHALIRGSTGKQLKLQVWLDHYPTGGVCFYYVLLHRSDRRSVSFCGSYMRHSVTLDSRGYVIGSPPVSSLQSNHSLREVQVTQVYTYSSLTGVAIVVVNVKYINEIHIMGGLRGERSWCWCGGLWGSSSQLWFRPRSRLWNCVILAPITINPLPICRYLPSCHPSIVVRLAEDILSSSRKDRDDHTGKC